MSQHVDPLTLNSNIANVTNATLEFDSTYFAVANGSVSVLVIGKSLVFSAVFGIASKPPTETHLIQFKVNGTPVTAKRKHVFIANGLDNIAGAYMEVYSGSSYIEVPYSAYNFASSGFYALNGVLEFN